MLLHDPRYSTSLYSFQAVDYLISITQNIPSSSLHTRVFNQGDPRVSDVTAQGDFYYGVEPLHKLWQIHTVNANIMTTNLHRCRY